MSNKSEKGASKKAQSAAYKATKRDEKNRIIRLKRALKRNPENQEIEKALTTTRKRRATPKESFWTPSKMKVAQLFKEFTGKFNKEILNNNEKISSPALFLKGPYSEYKFVNVPEAVMFQLGTRVRYKVGK